MLLRPNRFKKYHDSEEIQVTSMSGVSMPRCSIDLKRRVRGKGRRAVSRVVAQARVQAQCEVDKRGGK